VEGAHVYKMPLISKINIRDMELFPHYKPKRAAAGWKTAYVEFATPSMYRIWVEEIPPHTTKLIGRADSGLYVFIGISGKGYTEIRDPDKLDKPGQGVVWGPFDRFYMPVGSWYGHANPFDKPARILISSIHIDGDITNPYLGRIRTVPEQRLAGERSDPVPEDLVIENVDWPAALKQAELRAGSMKTLRRGPAKQFIVQGGLGGTVNAQNFELPSSHMRQRAADGWKAAHLEAGDEMYYRGMRDPWHELPPHSREIGHKHGGGLVFMGLKGHGYMALRATADSPEAKVTWGEFDIWMLPYLSPGGTWHSHCNPSDEPARWSTIDGALIDDRLLDARVDRILWEAGDGRTDLVFTGKQ
ncbi:MAG: hypothetical protein HY315_08725, partial [Acidobacteria bacterium]|nr:hypothetical protein [Acidobacteriota bacterium]